MEQPSQNTAEILKRAREAKGLSIERLHELTKIPLDVVKAIEEGYKVRSVSEFYLKGFIKMYAQQVGVDVHQVLKDYSTEKLPEPIHQQPEGQIEQKFNQFLNRQRQQLIVKGVVAVLLLVFLVKVIGCVGQRISSGVKQKSVEKIVKTQEPRKIELKKMKKERQQERVVPKQVQIKPTVAVVLPPQEKLPSGVSLSIKAKEQSWLQVKVDGNLVFQSILKPGVAETWQGQKLIELSGKNIHEMEYVVNGKTVQPVIEADGPARRVVITPEGLSAKQ